MTLVRPATPDDVAEMHAMIVELAVYEKEPDAVKASEGDLQEALFGARPVAEAIVAEVGSGLAGHAIFYTTFSTWEGRPGLWLEDLYVRPGFRGSGAGAALLSELAALTIRRGYTRLDWVALDWNTLALDFYARFGAKRWDEWKLHRLTGAALLNAAEPSAGRK